MKEATNYNRLIWRGIIFLCTFYFLHAIPGKAQNINANPELCQLLDSAEILKLKGLHVEAIAICNHIKEQARNNSDWGIYVRSLVELADINRLRYHDAKALSLISKSEKIIREYLDPTDPALIRYYIYKGKLYSDTHNLNDSAHAGIVVDNYKNAEELLNNKAFDARELAKLTFEKGRIYSKTGNTNIAEDVFQKLQNVLIDHFEETEYLRGWYYYYISLFYQNIGDYDRAILFSGLAKEIFIQPKNNDLEFVLKSELILANNYYYSKEPKLSIQHYNHIIENAEEWGFFDSETVFLAYLNRSQPLLILEDYEGARDNAITSLELLQMSTKTDSRHFRNLYYTYNSLAEAYEGLGDSISADRYYQKSIRTRINLYGLNHIETFRGFAFYGYFFERKGNYKKALFYHQKAMAAIDSDFISTDIYDNPDFFPYENKEQILYIIFSKAATLYKHYLNTGNENDLMASFKLYEVGYAELQTLLNSDIEDQSIILKFRSFERQFNLSIECAIKLFQLTGDQTYFDQAFQFVEHNKYFLLHQALANSEHRFVAGIPDSLFFKQRKLKRDISSLKHELENHVSSDSTFQIQNKLIKKLNRKSEIERLIGDFGDQSKGLPADSLLLTVHDVQNSILKAGEIIVEFHWSNNSIVSLIIGQDFVDVNETIITNKLTENLQEYNKIISGRSERNNYSKLEFRKFTNASMFLYNHLMKPVLKKIDKNINSSDVLNRIIIVPDGGLSYLAFESLITEIPDTLNISYWGLPYLAKELTISYAYSLNILKNNLSGTNQINTPNFLGFSYSKALTETADMALLRPENELPYSYEELEKIKNTLKKSRFYKGDKAQEDVFKSVAPNYSIIHLALHGQADTTDMFNSKLIFKKSDSSLEDGALHAYELYDIDLSSTELSVLSACETGLGKQSAGEGIFSIARGFAYAGCPAIVMSLWKVNDKATAALMAYFYQNLALGMEKDKALQEAKLSFINSSDDIGAHPSNWAAFIAFGNNQPIRTPESLFLWYHWFVFFIMILGVLFFIFKIRVLPRI